MDGIVTEAILIIVIADGGDFCRVFLSTKNLVKGEFISDNCSAR
jgi:hypothetical protein